MIRFSLFILLVLSAQAGLAAGLVQKPSSANYQSGHFLCDNAEPELLSDEHGVYVSVPVDYAHPEAGSTEIYTYFEKTFDAQKPTLVFFSGGPGQPSHAGLFGDLLVSFNVLLMDPRGVGCSRPTDVNLYLSPSFYSSENSARDAEEVRKALHISSWTVYGISYGTVPANIYASLFPAVTRSLILEGVVVSGEQSLWEAPHRRALVQKMLATLPADILSIVNGFAVAQNLPDTWLMDTARVFMGYNNGLSSLKAQLLSLTDPISLQNFVEQVKDRTSAGVGVVTKQDPLYVMNEIPYYMIACQELGLANPLLDAIDSLQKGVLVPVTDPGLAQNCAALGAAAGVTYEATRYPVKVPVTYFEGGNDGETAAPQAIQHYKTVPQGSKQLLILVDGGHNPNLQLLTDGNALQMSMFTAAIVGQRVSTDLVKQFNAQKDGFWAVTSGGSK